MFATRPSPLIIAAWLSLAVSVVLGVMPFVLPKTAIGPFIFLNWVLFILVGYWASPPFDWREPFRKMEPAKFRVGRLVFVAFVVAGWIAILNARTII